MQPRLGRRFRDGFFGDLGLEGCLFLERRDTLRQMLDCAINGWIKVRSAPHNRQWVVCSSISSPQYGQFMMAIPWSRRQ